MLKQVTIRLNKDFYKEIRSQLLKDDVSFNQYVTDLLVKDMNKQENKEKKEA